jgi:hypothetical protein
MPSTSKFYVYKRLSEFRELSKSVFSSRLLSSVVAEFLKFAESGYAKHAAVLSRLALCSLQSIVGACSLTR